MNAITKVEEKSEHARKEWFKKVEKLKKSYGHKFQQDILDRAAMEYTNVFGRVGMHPLMHLKGGKKLPRYVLDRDEVWVIYKPPLWGMGASQEKWKEKVRDLVFQSASLSDASKKMLESSNQEVIQEWHGLMQGQLWLDPSLMVEGWGFIQRLDMETDGPVVAAKTWRAQRALMIQMKEHMFSKAYMCLVHGRMQNKIQFVKKKFAELGSSEATQVMLEHDEMHDPFYNQSVQGKWKNRSTRWAETFVKPIAYYRHKKTDEEYTLAYVNILTGITHQIRITMQSLGHPLVSDDRYLPRQQALEDLKWCPRNFLCEVRSDWWDLTGQHKDEKRRRFTRVSLENPLPVLFRGILETKLDLVEKLDQTADLNVGCQYWALGDQQLMAMHPKDDEYRQKVIRWGQRKRIHLDALDRLLLLPKGDIDELLNNYKAPDDPDEPSWICPVCMALNNPEQNARRRIDKDGNEKDPDCCLGGMGHGDAWKTGCSGRRRMPADTLQLPKGWLNVLADPTIHLLVQVNKKWLDARKQVLKNSRPNWQRPPDEAEGTPCVGELRVNLEEAVSLNAKAGRWHIAEEDLAEMVPGCADIQLPLGEPPEDSKVRRARLPGRGIGSQWVYCLKGNELSDIMHKGEFKCNTKQMSKPLPVKADSYPAHRIIGKQELAKKAKIEAFRLKRKKELDAEEQKERGKKLLNESDEEPDGAVESSAAAPPSPDLTPAKKRKTSGSWQRLESKSNPGNFYYHNAESGETRMEPPPDEAPPPQAPLQAAKAPAAEAGVWSRLESNSNPGKYYYYNSVSGETSVDRPPSATALKEDQEPGIAWERRESKSKPGNFYYFNPDSGDNEIHPPRVDPPWQLKESSSNKGQYYYFNSETGASSEHPPRCAKPYEATATKAKVDKPVAKMAKGAAGDAKLPKGWERKASEKHAGKFYYVNSTSGETVWDKPVWERRESASNPGKVYYVHVETGETSWDAKK